MTSEQGDSNATWEDPKVIKQDQQPNLSSTTETPENQEPVISPVEADAEEESQNTRSLSRSRLGLFLRRFSPVLVPLPFAILIFLFTLPFALKGLSFLPLLPLAVLLIALVVMQGTMLYYAGTSDTYWTLFVIIGYSLFLVVGTLAIFGFGASLILLIILLIAGTFLARRSIRQVPEGYVDKLFVATTQSVINELTPADFINWPQGTHARTSLDVNSIDAATITRWDRINDTLKRRIQDQVAGWGVQVNYVHIQDITLIPHLAPSISPIASMTGRPVDAGMTRGGYPAAAQPQQAQVVFKPVENQPGAMPIQPPPAPASAADIEVLKEAYEAVRMGHLKDPNTIRKIAMRFEALANDPSVDFDPVRAAQNLYHRAWIYEQKNEEKGSTSEVANIMTQPQPDTKERGQTNENIFSGG